MIFYQPPTLDDGVIALCLDACVPMKGTAWAPSYQFYLYPVDTLGPDGRPERRGGRAPEPLGHIHLRVGMNDNIYYGGHIGYGVREPYRGHGYARRACLLVAPFARFLGHDELVITTTPDNLASLRTIEGLGAEFMGNVDVPRYHDLYKRGDRVISRFVWDISKIEPLRDLLRR
ncbi:MAG: GNAT family N-acetyltransferase [Clostridia bacterium]|nr:GNAT family N-acetyltransferase [Clostridia bacterium]